MVRPLHLLGILVCIVPASALAISEADLEKLCTERLSRLASATRLFISLHKREPEKLSELFYYGLAETDDFICPKSGTKSISRRDLDAKSDFVFTKLGDEIIVRETKTRYQPGNAMAVTLKGEKKWVGVDGTGKVETPQPKGPTPDPPQLAKANEHFNAGRFKEALSEIEAGLKDSPRNIPSIRLRGMVRLWTNDLKGARDDYSRLVEDATHTMEARRVVAGINIATGEVAAAKAETEALLKAASQDAYVVILHGQAALARGDTKEATASFAAAMKLDEKAPANLYQQANQFLSAGVPAFAQMQYRAIVWMKPDFSGAYYGLGISCAALGQRDDAVNSFKRYLIYDQTTAFAEYAKKEIKRLEQSK